MDTLRNLALRFGWNALAISLIAAFYGERIEVGGIAAVFWVVLLLALAQAFIRPALFLFRIVTFPLNLLTLGLASFIAGLVLNAIVFFAVGQMRLIEGFYVKDFWAALGATVLLSVANAIGNLLFGQRKGD